MRTVLLGRGGEVPAPGPTLPLPFPPQRSQATTALGRFLEELAHLWPGETRGGRTPKLVSFNNLERLSVGELQSKSKGPGLDHQPRAQETMLPSTHSA